MTRRRRLRVAVPPLVTSYSVASGTGKMWHRVLAALPADVRVADPARRPPPGRRPDAWLHDGHHGPLQVRAPVVVQLHEAAWDDPSTRSLADPSFVATYEAPSRAAAQRSARVVTPSESSRRQIVQSYAVPADRVLVAPHGVDHAVFNPGATGGSEVVARAGGDPARPYVLFVAQLHPRKNLAALRDAMTALARRGFPPALVIVGWPPFDGSDPAAIERDACADLPGTTGRVVHLRGITEDELAATMASASAFCLPSLMEGFGLPALEAMACGVPVVVSDRGALPEVVGDAGIVTAPSADALEDALASVLSDEESARALGSAALARSHGFTWDKTGAAWLRALEEATA